VQSGNPPPVNLYPSKSATVETKPMFPGLITDDQRVIGDVQKKIDEQWPLFDDNRAGKLGRQKIKELVLKIKSPSQIFDDKIFDEAYSNFEDLVFGEMKKESVQNFYFRVLGKMASSKF
jgi:capsid portal protein